MTTASLNLDQKSGPSAALRKAGHKIWIDLDNTPHVPFFKPIIRELERAGHEILVTARDAFQVTSLADRMGVSCTCVGRHYGKNPFMKVFGISVRAAQLIPLVLRHRPVLAMSHGSRAQILVANVLRIPSVFICDYEFAKPFPLSRPSWEFVPEAVSSVFLSGSDRVKKYPGIKEDVYVPDFEPDSGIMKELGLSADSMVVTVRPPATEAHYHNPESEVLFEHFMQRLTKTPGVVAVLLPRNKRQEEELRKKWPAWFDGGKIIVPDHAVDGLNLLWHSDLVVSGGGTMNREAAALGIPVYSIFRGKIGAVDRLLTEQHRLVLIESVEDADKKIVLARRNKAGTRANCQDALRGIIGLTEEILAIEYPGARKKV
ncbi:MAG TPA: DUF354 domain-containing protein [Candidatus Binatia bacterium]|nr:DUF354 domain-containing protein [Candidatus Binatia bacterium]